MAQERPNRFIEWLTATRQHLPQLRRQAGEWVAFVREEPQRVWDTPAVRYSVYGIGALLAAWIISFTIGLFAPSTPPSAKPQATTADYHVICTDPGCGTRFTIRRPFEFSRFPVECPTCSKQSGHAARLCNSPICRGRWVVPVEGNGVTTCPHCDTRFE